MDPIPLDSSWKDKEAISSVKKEDLFTGGVGLAIVGLIAIGAILLLSHFHVLHSIGSFSTPAEKLGLIGAGALTIAGIALAAYAKPNKKNHTDPNELVDGVLDLFDIPEEEALDLPPKAKEPYAKPNKKNHTDLNELVDGVLDLCDIPKEEALNLVPAKAEEPEEKGNLLPIPQGEFDRIDEDVKRTLANIRANQEKE